MTKPADGSFHGRVKLTLLLLGYPGLAWLLANTSEENASPASSNGPLIALFHTALYFTIAIGLLFLAGVPLWAEQCRRRPLVLTRSFRRGLRTVSAVIAVVLPLQGVLLAVALYIADSKELWFWGILSSAGAVIGTIVLLRSGLHDQPGVYLTLRAEHIQLEQHPRLSQLLAEVAEANRAPLPRATLIGLQAHLFSTTRTVFCPDAELEGGVLCLSLPASFVLSVAEFRALVGEALLGLQKDLTEGRAEFLSSTEAANGVLSSINDTMQQWSWWPRFGFHPAVLVFWFVLIASMRFPLYLGKELLKYYLTEFWTSRHAADVFHSVEAHDMSADDVGTIQVISALVKEAAMSVGSWRADAPDDAIRAMGEISTRILHEHPKLKFDRTLAAYDSVDTAWRYLRFRCSLSGVNLQWCCQMALEVSPEPSAASVFENTAALQARLEELWESPFVRVRR